MSVLRIGCVVPGCRRTNKVMFDADEEWICRHHISTIDYHLYKEYETAWEQAVAADEQQSADPAIYVRVTRAFNACKAALGVGI